MRGSTRSAPATSRSCRRSASGRRSRRTGWRRCTPCASSATTARRSIEFDAYGAGVPELAWIVEDAVLQDALWQGLEAAGVRAGAVRERSSIEAGACALTLERWRRACRPGWWSAPTARNSFVRAQARHRGARERLRPERGGGELPLRASRIATPPTSGSSAAPVLALLPLPGDQVSMVWSLPAARGRARVCAWSREALCREVEAASRGALGALAARRRAPRSYPLRRLAARRLVAPRVALAGDAGARHPSARRAGTQPRPAGRARACRRCWRRASRGATRATCACCAAMSAAAPSLYSRWIPWSTALFRLFGAESAVAARLRNAGLNLTDRAAGPKEHPDAPRDELNAEIPHRCRLLFARAPRAAANEAQIRKALEPKLGGAKIEGVQPGADARAVGSALPQRASGMQRALHRRHRHATSSTATSTTCAPTATSPRSGCAS